MSAEGTPSAMRLERALELYLSHAELGGDAERFLQQHADLRDLLEPMLGEHGVDEGDPGGELLGDFRIVGELGRGGMGVVYDAWQRSLDRRVALKVLAPALTADATAIARFRREAAAVARLRHPGIVEIIGFGSDDGRHWFAMERIDGEPLHRCGARFRQPQAAVAIAAQLADALQHAHAHGLVHRDVKPANVLVRSDGSAVLTDFGLASDSTMPSVTTAGGFLGTLDYASPEQAQGERTDGRTDIWSLGVVLFELLTGRRPFARDTSAGTLRSILVDEPPPLRALAPEVSSDLAAVVARALEKRREHRYPSAAALLADLRALAAGDPVSARHPGARERALRWARREPWRAVALAVVVVAVPVVAGAVGYLLNNAPKIAAADATERERQRELALSAAFLAVLDDDAPAAQRVLATLQATDDLEVTAVRAWCEDRLGDEARAVAMLDQLPGEQVTPAMRAWVLGKPFEAQQSRGSEEPFERFVIGLEQCLRARRDDDPALAREAATNLAAASLQYTQPRAMVLALWLRAATAADDRETAEALVQALERHFPDSPQAGLERAHMLSELDPERAVPLLEAAAAQPGVVAATLYNLGLACEKLRRFDDAMEHYRRCVDLNPSHARAHNNLGMLLRRKKDQAGAAAAFRAAVVADERHHKAWNNLGITLRALGETDAAKTALGRAIALRPDYAVAHSNLGNLLLAGGDAQGAMREYRAAIAADPDYAAPRGGLGNAQRDAGQKQQALATFAAAVDRSPRDVIPAYNLSRTALELGLGDLARAAAEHACRIAPVRRDVHELLLDVLQAQPEADAAAIEAVQAKLRDLR